MALESCTFEIEEKQKRKLEKIADEGYRTLSSQIRMIVEKYLSEEV